MLTYVLAADGSPLMPTYNIKKVRHMIIVVVYHAGAFV